MFEQQQFNFEQQQFHSIVMLIDAENTPSVRLSGVFDELSKRGPVVVRRAYGDWGDSALRRWRQPLIKLAIQPVQQFAWTNGKNASDICLVIDAMDLLHSGRHDAFALVTSDSDFTRLACRLREGQVRVLGFGGSHTPVSFQNACDEFVTIDPPAPPQTPRPGPGVAVSGNGRLHDPALRDEIVRLLRVAAEAHADGDGWTCVSRAGSVIKREHPKFTPRAFGQQKLSDVVALLAEEFEMQRIPRGTGHENLYRCLPLEAGDGQPDPDWKAATSSEEFLGEFEETSG